jgi:hypothetical protein
MAKKVALCLIILMAAMTLDFLRQEVFAWMDSRSRRESNFYDTKAPAFAALPGGTPSGATPDTRLGAYPYPPGSQRYQLFLPYMQKPETP